MTDIFGRYHTKVTARNLKTGMHQGLRNNFIYKRKKKETGRPEKYSDQTNQPRLVSDNSIKMITRDQFHRSSILFALHPSSYLLISLFFRARRILITTVVLP